jgi:(p)ppGpp synthase/HD superfamily hydrolase
MSISSVTPAEIYAFRQHERIGQKFPGTEASYMHHVHAVANVIRDADRESPLENVGEYLATAYSHDIIEDTTRPDDGFPRGRLLEEIEDNGGPVVVRATYMLTKDETLPKKPVDGRKGFLLYSMWGRAKPLTQMEDSLARINKGQHSNDDLLHKASRVAAAVKLADRIVNIEFPPPAYWSPKKIEEYRQEAGHILQTCGWANEYLSRRLSRAIEQYPNQCSRVPPTPEDDRQYRQRVARHLTSELG